MTLSGSRVGIGTASPVSGLHIYKNDTHELGTVIVEQDSTGDASVRYLLTGVISWATGIDNSDSDKFKISQSSTLNDSNRLTIDTSGKVGIGTDNPTALLDVEGAGNTEAHFMAGNGGSNFDMRFGDTSNRWAIAYNGGSHALGFYNNALSGMSLSLANTTGVATFGSHVLPDADNANDLGSAALQWRNIYTADFHLNNTRKEEGNDVDGTKGDWTIQEGKEDLYLLNNETGKKYKFNITEIE